MMRLIITRHGITEENLLGIFQGHMHGKLSATGIEQAKKLALRLKEESIDFIYSSDLARASDTAKEIARFHPKAPIIFVKELRERDLGEFQGKRKSDLGIPPEKHMGAKIKTERGESIEDLYKRAENFIHGIIKKHSKDTVLLVGHGTINKALIAAITGKSHEDILEMESQHNTSVNIFEIGEDGKHKIICLNCVKHLD